MFQIIKYVHMNFIKSTDSRVRTSNRSDRVRTRQIGRKRKWLRFAILYRYYARDRFRMRRRRRLRAKCLIYIHLFFSENRFKIPIGKKTRTIPSCRCLSPDPYNRHWMPCVKLSMNAACPLYGSHEYYYLRVAITRAYTVYQV